MLPCDAKKNYNPCAVGVNKYEPWTLGQVFILRYWRGLDTKKEHRDCDAL